jgi:hypothetical protein
MTIEEFDVLGFSNKTIIEYKGVNYNVYAVDFVEKLIGICMFGEDEDSELNWLRCENTKLISNGN